MGGGDGKGTWAASIRRVASLTAVRELAASDLLLFESDLHRYMARLQRQLSLRRRAPTGTPTTGTPMAATGPVSGQAHEAPAASLHRGQPGGLGDGVGQQGEVSAGQEGSAGGQEFLGRKERAGSGIPGSGHGGMEEVPLAAPPPSTVGSLATTTMTSTVTIRTMTFTMTSTDTRDSVHGTADESLTASNEIRAAQTFPSPRIPSPAHEPTPSGFSTTGGQVADMSEVTSRYTGALPLVAQSRWAKPRVGFPEAPGATTGIYGDSGTKRPRSDVPSPTLGRTSSE